MKPLEWKDVVRMHVEKFGVEPHITGINAMSGDSVIERVMDAIEHGKPYIEEEVPKDVLI